MSLNLWFSFRNHDPYITNKAATDFCQPCFFLPIQGKIIYIRITFTGVTIDRAKEIAATALEAISEEYLALYDVHFTLVQEGSDTTDGFTIMGAKNINRTSVMWNNNTAFTEEDTDGE